MTAGARVNRRTAGLLALCALAIAAAGWAALQSSTSAPETTANVPTCALRTLPPQAADTMREIHSNGPFPFPRNDGVVFGNREGHLPDRTKGYYREYTVVTPGAPNRSTRRIITGGTPATDPGEYFYTADHYDSFCLVVGAGGRS